MTWRSALLCSLLFHAVAVWAWTGWGLRTNELVTAPSVLAVMLHPAAATQRAPQPVDKAKAKSIVAHKLPQSAPIAMTQALKSNSLSAVNKTKPASAIAPALMLKTVAVAANAAQISAAKVESTSSGASAGTAVMSEAHAEGKITPAQYRAAHLQNPKPEMPYLSKVKGESGTVGLWVKVGVKGEPLAVKVEKSSGFTRLDNAAVQTVLEKWRFVPAKQGDTPIESEVIFNIPFKFED